MFMRSHVEKKKKILARTLEYDELAILALIKTDARNSPVRIRL